MAEIVYLCTRDVFYVTRSLVEIFARVEVYMFVNYYVDQISRGKKWIVALNFPGGA